MRFSPSAFAGDRPVAFAPPYWPPAASAVAVLASRACRWPLGEPGDADFAFCASPCRPDGSYCAVHARMARRGGIPRGATR